MLRTIEGAIGIVVSMVVVAPHVGDGHHTKERIHRIGAAVARKEGIANIFKIEIESVFARVARISIRGVRVAPVAQVEHEANGVVSGDTRKNSAHVRSSRRRVPILLTGAKSESKRGGGASRSCCSETAHFAGSRDRRAIDDRTIEILCVWAKTCHRNRGKAVGINR
jgi:hypothetical protein